MALSTKHLLKKHLVTTVLLVILSAGLIGQSLFITHERYIGAHIQDLSNFYRYGLNLLNGDVPYRDFEIEYPPLSLIPFTLPHLVLWERPTPPRHYLKLFLLENMLFCLLSGLIISYLISRNASLFPRPAVPIAVFVLAAIIISPLLPWRYDMFPALLTIISFLCLHRGRPLAAGVSLGLAITAKLYPVVLIPAACVYFTAISDFRAGRRFVLGLISTIVLLIPFFIYAPDWMINFFTYHQQRGLQIESLGGGFFLAMHALKIIHIGVSETHSALHIVSPLADTVLGWLPVLALMLFASMLLLGFVRFRKEYRLQGAVSIRTLAAYHSMALLILLICNKVFSPQYIIWLLPFMPLLRGRQATLLLIIYALTIIMFPFNYGYVIYLHPTGALLVNVRNLFIVILLVWLIIDFLPKQSGRPAAFRPDLISDSKPDVPAGYENTIL